MKKSETQAENSTSTSDNDNISESSVENPSSGGKSDSLQSGEPGAEEASTSEISAAPTPTVQTRASALKDESVSSRFVQIFVESNVSFSTLISNNAWGGHMIYTG